MIRAFHQVGTDRLDTFGRSLLLYKLIREGAVLPAINRLERREMYEECFGDDGYCPPLSERYAWASPKAKEALKEMVLDTINQMPEDGSKASMFNCGDVVAGDLENVFLTIGRWYHFENGFVFDAEELIKAGAELRPMDLQADFTTNMVEITKEPYRSVSQAKNSIQKAIDLFFKTHAWHGPEAIKALRKSRKTGSYESAELVFPGPLPVALAVEAWDDGVLI